MSGLLKQGRRMMLGLVLSLPIQGSAVATLQLATGCGDSCRDIDTPGRFELNVTDAATGEKLCSYSAELAQEGEQGGIICGTCPCTEPLSSGGKRFTLVISADGYADETRHFETTVDRCGHVEDVSLTVALTPL